MIDGNLASENGHQPVRILIADDEDSARNAIELFVTCAEDFQVVGVAKNGAEAVQLCADLRPDVVFMDARMPVMDGLAATRVVRQKYPRIQTIIVSMCLEPEVREDGLEAGAFAFIDKFGLAEHLVECIRAAGGAFTSQAIPAY